MPVFLENALRHEGRKHGFTGRKLDQYVYGGMNHIGAMHGNKETAKGQRMEAKHLRDQKKAKADSASSMPKESHAYSFRTKKPAKPKSGAAY